MDSTTQNNPSMTTDSVSDANRLEIAATAPCYLLDIAAELRNGIYELAFTVDDAGVDLLHSTPPSPALLQCCKQISEEATGIFKASIDHYYETKQFALAVDRDEEPLSKLDEVARLFDLQSMKHLHLELSYTWLRVHKVLNYALDTKESLWHFSNPGHGSSYHLVCIRKGTRMNAFTVSGENKAERAESLAELLEALSNDGSFVVTCVKDQIKILCKSLWGAAIRSS